MPHLNLGDLKLRINVQVETEDSQSEQPELQEEVVFCQYPMCQATQSLEVAEACQRNCIRRKRLFGESAGPGRRFQNSNNPAQVTAGRPAPNPIQIGP